VASLVLVRHGPSAHVHLGGAIDRAGVERWRADYDAAGLLSIAQPPAELVAVAARASCVLASDLARATESAVRLAGSRSVQSTPLLRELPLDVPAWPTRLPLGVWGTLIYLNWQYRVLRGTDPHVSERTRVGAATAFVTSQVGAGATGIVVTHGAFRKLLAAHLIAIGWCSTGRRGGYGHWSAWTFQASGSR
jgi:broad specificity phosphatase PhoE